MNKGEWKMEKRRQSKRPQSVLTTFIRIGLHSSFSIFHLMTDLKFAIRQLLKNPGFTTVACLCGARRQAVLTRALGI